MVAGCVLLGTSLGSCVFMVNTMNASASNPAPRISDLLPASVAHAAQSQVLGAADRSEARRTGVTMINLPFDGRTSYDHPSRRRSRKV